MPESTARPARLLIAWDGTPESNAAIPFALALAAERAHLVLLHIAPITETSLSLSPSVIARRAELHDHRLHVAREAMRHLAADIALLHPDLTFEIVCGQGDPAREIQRIAIERDVNVIVAALHHERAMRSAAHQSIALQLTREATIPTLIVRYGAPHPADELPFRRLLCPFIATHSSTRTVRAASQLARSLELPLRVTAVVDPAAVLPDSLVTGVTSRFSAVEDIFAAQVVRVTTVLDQTTARLRRAGVAASAATEYGPIVECICGATMPGDLIVLNPADLVTNDDDHALAQLLREAPAPILALPTPPAQSGQPVLTKGSLSHV